MRLRQRTIYQLYRCPIFYRLFSDLIDHELHKINYDAKKDRFIGEHKSAHPSSSFGNGNI